MINPVVLARVTEALDECLRQHAVDHEPMESTDLARAAINAMRMKPAPWTNTPVLGGRQ